MTFTVGVGAPDWSPDALKVHPISPHETMEKSEDSADPPRGVLKLPAPLQSFKPVNRSSYTPVLRLACHNDTV